MAASYYTLNTDITSFLPFIFQLPSWPHFGVGYFSTLVDSAQSFVNLASCCCGCARMQAAAKSAQIEASTKASEKRRMASELAAAQKGYGELQTRISNMNSLSAMNAAASAKERAATEEGKKELLAQQQTVRQMEVRTNALLS